MKVEPKYKRVQAYIEKVQDEGFDCSVREMISKIALKFSYSEARVNSFWYKIDRTKG